MKTHDTTSENRIKKKKEEKYDPEFKQDDEKREKKNCFPNFLQQVKKDDNKKRK